MKEFFVCLLASLVFILFYFGAIALTIPNFSAAALFLALSIFGAHVLIRLR